MTTKDSNEQRKKELPDYVNFPSYIFQDRTLKVLEAIVEFLKDKRGYTYKEIAILLNRNERTIWTVYQRSRRKREHARK
ncbi:MAG: helix-turn-helix domain-containing protein [archaeon]